MNPNDRCQPRLAFQITAAAASDAGKLRAQNEDAYSVDVESGLFIVSDGMGGEHFGALASKIVIEVLPALLGRKSWSLRNLVKPAARRALLAALGELSDLVRQKTAGQPGLNGMGATVVLALVRGGQAWIAHLGDSRAYLFRDGTLQQLTRDHLITQLLIESGDIQPEEAATHPAHGQLSRYVGMKGEPLPEACSRELRDGDRLLLCTDGLTGLVGDDELQAIFGETLDPQETCQMLIHAANAAGGKDNITAVVVQMEGPGNSS